MKSKSDPSDSYPRWRKQLNEVIFGTETPAGKAFDVILLVAILLSILLVMLESVKELREGFPTFFLVNEWVLTILFTIEYIARIIAVKKPLKYIFSWYGLIDLISILPTYIGLFVAGNAQDVGRIIRIIRLLRIARILKLGQFLGAATELRTALWASRVKITVFLGVVLTISVIAGAIMYVVEGPEHGFTSIPRGIYWAIVTVTTVGYGDISPETIIGQTLASILMILGYGVIAVPTGIVSAELVRTPTAEELDNRACPSCGADGHEADAKHCKYCGSEL